MLRYKEAQVRGLSVVVQCDMLGGFIAFSILKNLVIFDDYDNARKSIIYALENHREF
ncbi:hypothetical protein ACNQ6O_04745 [Marinobacter sp. SBS5]|uniref:hypothetical protein n=1 Tax=Marinobacter sp. SBS5 TaxID=3401754 RepID=UPI003AAE97C5